MGTNPPGTGFGQWGTGPNGEPIVARIIAPLTGAVGQVFQLEVADIYQDGSGAGLADPGSWWTLEPEILSLTSDGIATCVSTGQALIGTLQNGIIFIDGIFTVTIPIIVSIVIIGNVSSLDIGQTEQLSAIGTYTDGSTKDVTSLCTWSASSPVAGINSAAFVTALRLGSVTLTATLTANTAIVASVSLYVTQAPIVVVPQFRSHLTQVMQNYFDYKDVRVRKSRYAIDAQLLNVAAQQIEMSGLRLGREVNATTLHSCPANIDRGGCYWQQRLPSTVDLTASTHTVVATVNTSSVTLVPYDDQLPVPVSVSVDTNIAPILMTTPLMFETYGIGDPIAQAWSVQRLGPFVPLMSDRIHFWVDGPGYFALNILVRIIGQRAPAPAWSDALSTTSELIKLNSLGWAQSKFAWATITQVQILNLPVGVSLSAYTGSFSLPMYPDVNRPYTDPEYRDVLFDRYWSSSGRMLTEQYLESDYAGWRYNLSYQLAVQGFTGLAVEPNTWGMFAGYGSTLYYFDRREPLPGSLPVTALTREPYYGLDVSIDETNLTPIPFIVLQPIPYGNASSAGSYRFLVTTPDGNMYAFTPDGFFTEYTRNAGWRSGTPPTVSIPLAVAGTYVFYLQAIGPDGVVVQDAMPWPSLAFNPLATLDVSGLVSDIQGLAFDDRNRLWIWTGTQAIPVNFQYNAYLIDQNSQSIYLTDSATALVVDGAEMTL
jgi:hypothetical protein